MSNKAPKMNRKKALAMLGVAACVAYATPNMISLGEAKASGGKEGGFFGFGGSGGGNKPRGFGSGAGAGWRITDQLTATECGDCHEAYGPDGLPQGAWRRVMADLSNHFGEDASLDEQTRRHIENYLVSNANPGDGPMRITEQPWFSSEHRGEVSQWQLNKAKSWANCQSCHGSGRR